MTVTRIGQITAETQLDAEMVIDGIAAPVLVSDEVNTGNFSWKFTSQTGLVGLGFPRKNGLRSSAFMRHLGLTVSTQIGGILSFRSVTLPGRCVDVRWHEQSDNIQLLVDGVEQDAIGAVSSGFGATEIWHSVGLFAQYNAGVPSASEIAFYLDGIQILGYTGSFTPDMDAAFIGGRLGSAGWSNMWADDFYVDEISGENRASPPSYRFLPKLANGVGNWSDWTPVGAATNHEAVDETGVPDGDTTHNYSNTDGDRDTFSTSPATLPLNHEVTAAIPYAISKKLDASLDAQLRLVAYDGLNETVSVPTNLPIDYRAIYSRMTLQPDGSQWNEADINAMEFGYETEGFPP